MDEIENEKTFKNNDEDVALSNGNVNNDINDNELSDSNEDNMEEDISEKKLLKT